MIQTFENLIQDLKNKVYSPVYLLHGEESYYIDVISGYIEKNVLDEMEKEFNQTVLYGRDVDMLSLVSIAKRYPMMSNYQVVIIKEAQNIKNLIPKGDKKQKDEPSPLEVYLQKPVPSTILVFCHKHLKVDGRYKISRLFETQGVVYYSKKLYDNQVPDWVKKYCASKKYRIDERATQLIAEYLGSDLSKVSNELDKLMLNVPPSVEINSEHIEQNIGISKDFNVFELNDALGEKNILKANRIVRYFGANQKTNPLVVTLGSLLSYFNKLIIYHTLPDKSNAASAMGIVPFFLRDYERAARHYQLPKLRQIISLLREYDLKSKGVDNPPTDQGELLKEMVFRIIH